MKMTRYVIRTLFVFGLWLGVGLQAQAQTDKVTYVYTDPQGTPLVEADASGNVVARYDYTPYGNTVTSLSGAPDGPGYTGHVNDPETGLVYMQARYFQPFGRFLSPDPVGPEPGNLFGFNRYAYVNNNPITNTDPTGRESAEISYETTKSLTEAMNQRHDPKEAKAGLIMMGVVYGGAVAIVAGPEMTVAGMVRGYRAWKFERSLNQVRKRLDGWTETPNKKGVGSRFEDPANPKGNRVRVDMGTPDHAYPSQRVDHVVEQRNGVAVDANGKPIISSKPTSTPEAHIPLKTWLNKNG